MSSTITTRLEEPQEPQDGSAGVAREFSDALVLRAARTQAPGLTIGSRSFCPTS